MNTSRIGTDYERRYRAELEGVHGMLVTRSAASKGLFDLIAYDTSTCWHVQLKAGYMSCIEASRTAAFNRKAIPIGCKALVVHPRRYDGEDAVPFCEHVG